MAEQITLVEGRLAPVLDELETAIMEALQNPDSNPIATYIDMIDTDPEIGACVELEVLLGMKRVGEYQHEDERIQDFVTANLENLKGGFQKTLGELFVARPLGYVASEMVFRAENREWFVDQIFALHPENYEFRGKDGELEELRYMSSQKGDITIPYEKVIHIANNDWLAFGDPHGKAQCKKALASHLATRIVQNLMMTGLKTQATPLLVGKASATESVNLLDPETGLPMENDDGSPKMRSALSALHDDLVKIGSNGVITTDLANSIESIANQTDGMFFLNALTYLRSLKLLSFLVPETAFTVTGTGDSNLASNQSTLLMASISAFAERVKHALIQCAIRPLIEANFGVQDSYGGFATPEENKIDEIALLDALARAAVTGVLGVPDIELINKARELAGLPPVQELIPQVTVENNAPGSTTNPTDPSNPANPAPAREPARSGSPARNGRRTSNFIPEEPGSQN